MNSLLILLTIFLPIFAGFALVFVPIKNRKAYLLTAEIVTVITSVLAWTLIINPPADSILLFTFLDKFDVGFKIDGASRVFAGLVSSLWPFATLYAMEYMEHETKHEHKTLSERSFFGMYTITFGVTLGISFAENLISLYVFYEMLTIVTIPLILFSLSKEAVNATRMYITYSLGGAAFAFIGLIFLVAYSDSITFTLGGVLNSAKYVGKENLLRLIYIFAFFGFGVKAAVFPFNAWLPKAGVAPTPVTALLHAVAVVKSGAFALLRLTFYSYGPDLLKGSFAQYITMGFAIFTIVYGCSMAVKERHIKRRLAYSTISNLSYIVFGITLMTPLGMVGAMTHMIFHGVMKIASFFCAGAVIVKANKTYVYELEGMGKRMPAVFAIFTVSSFALMGVPGLCGFMSKWKLAEAAISLGTVESIIGFGAILVSAILTAIYMMQIVLRAYYPVEEVKETTKCDPTWKMLLPLCVFTVAIVVFGLYSSPLISFFEKVAGGII